MKPQFSEAGQKAAQDGVPWEVSLMTAFLTVALSRLWHREEQSRAQWAGWAEETEGGSLYYWWLSQQGLLQTVRLWNLPQSLHLARSYQFPFWAPTHLKAYKLYHTDHDSQLSVCISLSFTGMWMAHSTNSVNLCESNKQENYTDDLDN